MIFAYPDSSDIEEDCDGSDNDVAAASSSGDGLSIGSPQAKPSKYANAIDLTDDEFVSSSHDSSHVIINGQPSAAEISEDMFSDPVAHRDIQHEVEPMPSIIILHSDDEDGPAASVVEYESAVSISHPGSPKPRPSGETDIVNTTTQSAPSATAMASQRLAEMVSFASGECEPCDRLRTHGPNFDNSDYETESEIGLTDAEEEGFRVFQSMSQDKDKVQQSGNTTEDRSILTSLEVQQDNETTDINAGNDFEALNVSPSLHFGLQEADENASSSNRLPSPSDAAMVKPNAPQSLSSVPVHHLPSSEWKCLASQSFQISSKRPVNAEDVDRRDESMFESDVSYVAPATENANPHGINYDEYIPTAANESVTDVHNGNLVMDIPPRHRLVIDKDRTPKENEAPVTSAIVDGSLQTGRSKLRIDDIIDSSTPEAETHKRKADDISDVVVDEIQAWASASSLDKTEDPAETTTTSMSAPDPVPSVSDSESSTSSTGTRDEPQIGAATERRSNKRLKKVVEGAAYIALGGVGLFSLLVATAPDFM